MYIDVISLQENPCLMGKSCWFFCRISTKQRAHRRGGEVSGHAQQRAQRPAQH